VRSLAVFRISEICKPKAPLWGIDRTTADFPNIEKEFVFIGEYTYSIDQKGRVALPAKFRDELKQGCVVTRGLDKSLFIYPVKEWDKIAKKLADMPITSPKARAFARLMLAGAMAVDLDRQGRITIPGYLRDFASIKAIVVVAGLYDRLEVWSQESWKEYQEATEKDDDFAANLEDLGI
jgi:MraZ protein